MGVFKRYTLTASGIVFALIFLVVAVRVVHRVMPSSHLKSIKAKGPENAPIRMVVYSDFQCPACRSAIEPAEELRNEFADVMQVEFRHFPLEHAHAWAMVAAGFAECAAKQGKFWEYHDQLYKEQEIWSHAQEPLNFFVRYSKELGLNSAKMEQCLEDPKTLNQIRSERTRGEKQGVQSTPTYFLNGRPLVGALQLKTYGKTTVVEELKKLTPKSHG